MKALETARTTTLPHKMVAISGDWHGAWRWLSTLAPAITTLAPDVSTVLQLGDWWMQTDVSDRIFIDAGIERAYVTLGSHEPWGEISPPQHALPCIVSTPPTERCSRDNYRQLRMTVFEGRP